MINVANIMEEGRFSGQHKRIISVAKRLKKKGIKTIVYFSKKDSHYFKKELCESEIDFRCIGINRPSKDYRYLIRYFFYFVYEILLIRSLLIKDKIDIVHCNGSWQIKGAIAAKLAGKIVVWHLNDTKRPVLIKIIFNILVIFLADRLILASHRVKDYYLSNKYIKRKRYDIIQAPINTGYFNPNKLDSKACFKDYGGLNILTVANVNPVKGIEYFIDMASLLSEKYKDLNFHIVGSIHKNQIAYYRKLKKRIVDFNLNNVFFHGFSSDIPQFLKDADVYVCGSLFEASPTTVWEAMSMQKPIVATDAGDIPIMIENGVSGFVVETCNGFALAEKVAFFIEHPEMATKFGEEARERAINRLDTEICVDAHNKVYQKLFNSRVI